MRRTDNSLFADRSHKQYNRETSERSSDTVECTVPKSSETKVSEKESSFAMCELQSMPTVLRERNSGIFGENPKRAIDFFGRKSFRQYQKEAIEEIETAFEKGYRHIILEAPTGSGKSEIAACFARLSNDAHILTIQKLLQTQYQNDFPEMAIMKGRNAYSCIKSEEGATCAEGPCRLKKQESCPGCPYRLAKIKAMAAPVTVHNFDSFYYQNSFGTGFSGRKLIIIDEAHNIAGKFSDFLSFTINSRGGIDVPEAYRIADYDAFVHSAWAEYSDEYGKLQIQHSLVGLSKENLKRMEDLNRLIHRMGRYLNERGKDNPAEYVFDYSKEGRWAPSVTFRPVFVGDYASRWLFGYGERSLMMSATILNKEMFCKEVGLNPKEVYYINVPSSFPAENRPILKKYAGRMGYKYIKGTLPMIVEYVQEIIDRYPNRKGIVQCHSEKIAGYLKKFLDDPRYTFNKDYQTPQQMLEVHVRKPGSIIIASGLREGLDLRGELSKIQVFCKIPYPSLGDKVVARKLELDESWYGWITTVMFVQSLGRSVRSAQEKAITFILDSGFGFFYTKNKRFLPAYIKEAIKW